MPYRRYSIPCREIALNRPFLYIYVCINRKGGELKSDLDFGFPLGGSTRVRLLAVSRRCAYLPVPEIAIDTHRTVRLCRLQPILRITIGSLPLLREYDYTPALFPAAIRLPIPDFSSKHPPSM